MSYLGKITGHKPENVILPNSPITVTVAVARVTALCSYIPGEVHVRLQCKACSYTEAMLQVQC